MTALQTRDVVSTLTAWMLGSALVDDLVPQTEALLARLTTAKPSRTAARPVVCQYLDTATLTDAQLFAHYKRSSCRLDCAFALAHLDLEPTLRTAFEALHAELETRASTTADRKAYNRLVDTWRTTATARRAVRVSAARLARKLDHARLWLTRQPVDVRKAA